MYQSSLAGSWLRVKFQVDSQESTRVPVMQEHQAPPPAIVPSRNFPASTRGVALIFVLAMLVLLLGLVLAFFSRVSQQRQIAMSSVASIRAQFLFEASRALLLEDFLAEIEAGSEAEKIGDTTIHFPRAVDDKLPSLLPQATTHGFRNLLKTSRHGIPFFAAGPWSGGIAGPQRASAASTATGSRNGIVVSRENWRKPGLLTEEEFAAFEAPDWIYINRQGEAPSIPGPGASDPNPNNPDYVIGRFAYAVYDGSKLVDVHALGNQLDAAENSRRGKLHQVSADALLTAMDDQSRETELTALVRWRWPVAAGQDPSNPVGGNLFDPARDFIGVLEGEQGYIGRQDFLAHANLEDSPLPDWAASCLTVAHRELDAPLYAPDPAAAQFSAGADIPSVPAVATMNPPLLAVRFPQETVLRRGSDSHVVVPAGTPVMPRRFPLSKLSLLEEGEPADSIAYYFGLENRGPGVWEYTAAIPHEEGGGRIATLEEVAELGREPNFFEVLQAVILTGSMGKSGGSTFTPDAERDRNRYFHVMQLGANIIDQWDTDDIPTTILFLSGVAGEPEAFHGVENLPYINALALTAHKPEYGRNGSLERFQIWAVFDVWNPHQNALTPPQGITEFRIRPAGTAGRVLPLLRYSLRDPDGNGAYTPLNDPYSNAPWQFVHTSHGARELTFPTHPTPRGYADPVILGPDSAPESEQDSLQHPRGILLYDLPDVPTRVPSREMGRTESLQISLNTLMEHPLLHPYTALGPAGSPASFVYDSAAGDPGERIYPTGTSFENFSQTNWRRRTLGDDRIGVSANFGTKAYNAYQLRASNLVMELQAFVTGQGWRTYQVIDQFLTRVGHSTFRTLTASYQEFHSTDLQKNSHHSDPDADLTISFYAWREFKSGSGAVKMDPRSIRFGHSENWRHTIGNTLRMSPLPYTGSSDEAQNFWRVLRADVKLVGASGSSGFQRSLDTPTRTNRLVPMGLVTNIPEGNVQHNTQPANPSRYSDRDLVFRPADGYLGTLPTIPLDTALPQPRDLILDRPLILNRPFRSIGDLGYVFRDLPYKTIDFFSGQSADSGLLDAFSLDEADGATPLVAGRLNLNSVGVDTLAALLEGTALGLDDLTGVPSPGHLDAGEAREIAQAIVEAREESPFLVVGDLVERVLAPTSAAEPAIRPGGTWAPNRKTEREAAIRTLSALTATRTWNFIVDLVVQTGNLQAHTNQIDDFVVRSKHRYWLHIAVDRMTGQVLDQKVEMVDD